MLHQNVFLKISNEYYQLTSSEKKVADYISLHQQKTQYMSISELADDCDVAEATISRFCKKLDYKGYNAFKLAVANSTANRALNNPMAGEVLAEDTVVDMCQKVYSADVDAITETLALVVHENITRAADILVDAGQVLCMGQGGSMILAQETAHLFSTVTRGFVCVWDSHLQAIAASQMTPNDAVLFFSYSGATKDLIEILKIVKSTGAKAILITRFPKSPGAAIADVVLQCGSKEGPLQLGSIAARIAQLFLVDLLFSEVCRRDLEGCRTHREQVADALSDKHI